jgi:hypothetical protein
VLAVFHDEDDQIVPVRGSAMKSARLIKGAKGHLLPRRAARHHGDAELLAFLPSSPNRNGGRSTHNGTSAERGLGDKVGATYERTARQADN